MRADLVKDHILMLQNFKQDVNAETKTILRIFDICSQQLVVEVPITHPFIIGRLFSGLYSLIDSHIYFGNSVLKMRMDKVDPSLKITYTEKEFFDLHENLFTLSTTEKVGHKSPFISMAYHRMAYLMYDDKKYLP